MQSRTRFLALLTCSSLLALTSACDEGGGDADAGADSGPAPCAFLGLAFSHASYGVTVGSVRDGYLELDRDACDETTLVIETTGAGSVTGLPSTYMWMPGGESRLRFELTGETVGELSVIARATSATGIERTAEATISISAGAIPDCTGATAASGNVAPGGELVGTGSLSDARVAVEEGASREGRYHVDAFDAQIACAADQTPTGYLALGPAVSFTSSTAYRFQREIELAIPIATALLPSHAHRGHVEVVYTGPGVAEPRVVPIADPLFEGLASDGVLHFRAPRLGTYQAIVRADAPTRRTRRFTYRGLMGFSMGGSGSGRIGFGNPDTFDFVAPLGGPTEWTYLLEYIRQYHLGGFCTAEQYEANPSMCNAGSQDYAPERGELYEHVQHFEHWWFQEDEPQGSVFNRSDYISIFRDLAAMYGNPNTDTSEDDSPSVPNVLPPGVPDSLRGMSDSARCEPSALVRMEPEPEGGDADPATGFFDDEYNPLGRYAVITFCDGAERSYPDGSTDVGNWDPTGSQRTPVEVGLAVDWNGNGVRDPGEPVIRNGRENFSDVGLDGIASVDEVSMDGTPYHPVTNPDPAGDDYDFQFNPLGTEGNFDRDGDPCGEGEPYVDWGIDGVEGTAQLSAGGYDVGEGNGCFDRTRGADRMVASSPLSRLRGYRGRYTTVEPYTEEQLGRFDTLIDGGLRDLFNWVVMGHHALGGFAARGLPTRIFNGHYRLHMDRSYTRDAEFSYTAAPWEELGRHVMVRYGHLDPTARQLEEGDGGHVGTTTQLVNRFYSAMAMMSARWPEGDRRIVRDLLCPAMTGACRGINSFDVDFTSPTTGRTGPMSVVLPPGYFHEENADRCYPVVYFLHGYGMSPQDLRNIGILLWQEMVNIREPTSRRVQKMIFVFPDGECRGDECRRGTFYTDAPPTTPNGPQMETFLLDFMDYMDTNYRTCDAREFEVVE